MADALAGQGVGERRRVPDERPARTGDLEQGRFAGGERDRVGLALPGRGGRAAGTRGPPPRRAGRSAARVGTARERRADADLDVAGPREDPQVTGETGVKRTSIGASPSASQPDAISSRAAGVGPSRLRLTRLPAPSAPTTTSNTSRCAAARSPPASSTAITRSARCRAPASTARRSSHASSSRRAAISMGERQADVDRAALARVEPAHVHAPPRQRVGDGGRRQQGQRPRREPAAAGLLARVRGVEQRRLGAGPGELPREQAAGRSRPDDRDPHATRAAGRPSARGRPRATPGRSRSRRRRPPPPGARAGASAGARPSASRRSAG